MRSARRSDMRRSARCSDMWCSAGCGDMRRSTRRSDVRRSPRSGRCMRCGCRVRCGRHMRCRRRMRGRRRVRRGSCGGGARGRRSSTSLLMRLRRCARRYCSAADQNYRNASVPLEHGTISCVARDNQRSNRRAGFAARVFHAATQWMTICSELPPDAYRRLTEGEMSGRTRGLMLRSSLSGACQVPNARNARPSRELFPRKEGFLSLTEQTRLEATKCSRPL